MHANFVALGETTPGAVMGGGQFDRDGGVIWSARATARDLLSDLVGRERERRLLDTLAVAVMEQGAALVLWGEPGIGKTALLDHVARTTTASALRAQGVESEAVLPFATLADLLLPLRSYFRDLPRVQREALEVCLALSQQSSTNPYAACIATLNVLAAAGEAQPTVLLVDDLHWVDPSSRRVLLFVARRLSSERAAVILTIREDDTDLTIRAGLPSLRVTGLTLVECAELLHRWRLDAAPRVLDDLMRMTGGNPLALLETASALPAAQLRGEEPMAHLPSPGQLLLRAWSPRFDELPDATREALAVVAASRSSTVAALQGALAVKGLTLAALSPAETAGLVTTSIQRIEFRHPVLRPLILSATPLAQRLAAFRALAQASCGVLRAWYQAAGTAGPDEEAAQGLADAALDARRRSAFDEAALAWRRAADLTAAGPRRADRLRLAAADAFLGGVSLDAARWCEEALCVTTDPLVRADIELLRGRIYTWTGQPSRAHHLLVQAAQAVRETDALRACALLTEAAMPAVMDGKVRLALQIAEESFALAERSAPDFWPASVVLGESLILAGRVAEGRDRLSDTTDALANADPVRDQQLLAVVAQLQAWTDDPDAARRLLTRVIEAARQHGAPAVLPFALAARSELETWAGRWAAAHADATEALHWAEDLRQVSSIGYCLACLARLDAVRGDRARCEEAIAHGREEVGPFDIGSLEVYFAGVLGIAALAHGQYQAAIGHLETAFQMSSSEGLSNPNVVPFAADLVEAHARSGNPVQAAKILDWLEESARRTGLAWPQAAAARCRVLLAATYADAEFWFEAAQTAHRRRDTPFERARTQLCYGEMLRRFRHPAAARAPLTVALATFQSLGAVPWAKRASVELAAAGQRPTIPIRAGVLNQLTPQELQVARAITAGLNNSEAAASLFVSRKTVEAHLTRVYRKLGVRSRTDLTRAMTAEGVLD